MFKCSNNMRGAWYYRDMTVAHIREPEGADHVQVVFLESARFYTLRRDKPSFDQELKLLGYALARPRVLRVGFVSLESETIEEVLELP